MYHLLNIGQEGVNDNNAMLDIENLMTKEARLRIQSAGN